MSGSTMSTGDVLLVAYAVLEAALIATSFEAATAAMQVELEVLGREDLVRVAKALGWETTQVLTPKARRVEFARRLETRRLQAMVEAP